MARAQGARAQLASAFEATYGTPPASGYAKLPFVSSTIGSEQGLIASDLLGQGRDPAEPIRDVVNVDGDIVVPVDLRNFGRWLKLVFGEDAVTGTGPGPYTHTFVSGEWSLPSMALEVGMPEVPYFAMCTGVRANSLSFRMQRSGPANATVSCIAQGEAKAAATAAGTPTEAALERFNQFQGSIKRDGAALANVVSGEVTYSNNLDRIETIRNDGRIDGADPSIASMTGTIDCRFADTVLLDLAISNTPVELEFGFTISATKKLTVTAHQVFLPKPRLAIQGPGGVQASFAWQAARDTSPSRMATVVLVNDVADY
ncbi:MAG: hypothetical protein INR68_05425 [Methylobacterium mesophilicum]|nr:hypothetical protein [Methylobacterium mesophilicum]